VLEPESRVCIEGNNQKQADFLAKALAGLDPSRINRLHILQSVIAPAGTSRCL
jgi:malonate decarboxylase alpha subunit